MSDTSDDEGLYDYLDGFTQEEILYELGMYYGMDLHFELCTEKQILEYINLQDLLSSNPIKSYYSIWKIIGIGHCLHEKFDGRDFSYLIPQSMYIVHELSQCVDLLNDFHPKARYDQHIMKEFYSLYDIFVGDWLLELLGEETFNLHKKVEALFVKDNIVRRLKEEEVDLINEYRESLIKNVAHVLQKMLANYTKNSFSLVILKPGKGSYSLTYDTVNKAYCFNTSVNLSRVFGLRYKNKPSIDLPNDTCLLIKNFPFAFNFGMCILVEDVYRDSINIPLLLTDIEKNKTKLFGCTCIRVILRNGAIVLDSDVQLSIDIWLQIQEFMVCDFFRMTLKDLTEPKRSSRASLHIFKNYDKMRKLRDELTELAPL